MKQNRWSWMLGLLGATMGLSGCSSDAVALPEAELTTPGAFIAVRDLEPGHPISLIRTIDRLNFEFETLIFFTTYDVEPTSWDDARELAKQHDLGMRVEIEAQPAPAITTRSWQVVWFRTLTDEELERVR